MEWSSHEPEPGNYSFDGQNDLLKFIQLAADNDLLVILRPGPFIDSERDQVCRTFLLCVILNCTETAKQGGLPYWLLRDDPSMTLRSRDGSFLKYVDKWFSVLLPMVRPFLYHNGGPIITMQVENEYGFYGCDHVYMEMMRDMMRQYLGPELVLFTIDVATDRTLECGTVSGTYATMHFADGVGDVRKAFELLRQHDKHAPLVNSEFYPGWFDFWPIRIRRSQGKRMPAFWMKSCL